MIRDVIVSQVSSSVPTHPLGEVQLGSLAWRRHGRVQLSALVKATFRLRRGEKMERCQAQPLRHPSEHRCHDYVPFVLRREISLEGQACTQQCRLSVFDVQHQPLLDAKRQLPEVPNPQAPVQAGFGPGVRDLDLDFGARIVVLPDEFALTGLQAVAADQWLKSLQGDEWVGFGGFTPEIDFYAVQLPGLSAQVRCYRSDGYDPISLDLESIQLDADKLLCHLIWRGQIALANEAQLSAVQLQGGAAAEVDSLPWCDPYQKKVAVSSRHTVALDSRGILAAATPFLKPASSRRTSSSGTNPQAKGSLLAGSTVDLSSPVGALELAQPPATAPAPNKVEPSRAAAVFLPFLPQQVAIGEKATPDGAKAPPATAEDASLLSGMTVDAPSPLTPELMAQLGIQIPQPKRPTKPAGRPPGTAAADTKASPSASLSPPLVGESKGPGPSAPAGAVPLGTVDFGQVLRTADLSDQERQEATARPALPFHQGQVNLPVAEASRGPISRLAGFGSTLDLTPRQSFDAATTGSGLPFEMSDNDGNRIGLGQHFLAAMSALGGR